MKHSDLLKGKLHISCEKCSYCRVIARASQTRKKRLTFFTPHLLVISELCKPKATEPQSKCSTGVKM